MPKMIKREARPDSKELENRCRKARDPVARSHHQTIWLISEGKTTAEVMEVTGYSRVCIQQLARRYDSDGPEALGGRGHQRKGSSSRRWLSQAGWHTAKKKLRAPEGLHLEFLPPHSPELQPAERLRPLSDEGAANRHFEEIEDLEETLVERYVALSEQPEVIRSHIRYHWWPGAA